MSTKFEQLLDYLVNEEHEKANELFHEIVVEKSREIYENLIAEEEEGQQDESADDEQEESVEEADDEQEESVDEAMDDEQEESVELEDSYMLDAEEEPAGGDATDKLPLDIEPTDGEEEGDPESAEDKAIFDIKNAIQELEAAFAELQQAQGSEEPHGDADAMPGMDKKDDDEADEMMGLREYRETVGNDWEKNSQKAQGQLAGAGTGEKQSAPSEGKSIVNKEPSGKPQSGANAKNLNQGGAGEGTNTGTSPNGKTGGLAGGVKGDFTKGVEKNISSSASSKMKDGAALSKQGAGYPGNNKTAGPVGSGTGDKAGQTSGAGNAVKPLIKKL